VNKFIIKSSHLFIRGLKCPTKAARTENYLSVIGALMRVVLQAGSATHSLFILVMIVFLGILKTSRAGQTLGMSSHVHFIEKTNLSGPGGKCFHAAGGGFA
jgi:hypothetical protein